MLVIFLVSFNLPMALADTPPNDDEILYKSDGTRSEGMYIFAGGSSCCGCNTQHFGNLPGDFPTSEISAVTFYLAASRSNSEHNRVTAGETKLKLQFTDSSIDPDKTWISEAISQKLDAIQKSPVEHQWLITFVFDNPVTLKPGMRWDLLGPVNTNSHFVI